MRGDRHRIGPWPDKPRLADVLARRLGKPSRRGHSHSQLEPDTERRQARENTLRHGRPWRGPAKLERTAVVLVDRIDCRSRRAARGPSNLRAKSSRNTRVGLAPPRESEGGVKKRRKPDRWRRSREIGGGLSQTAKCESTRRRALVDERRSDSGRPVALTCDGWQRIWTVVFTSSREGRRAAADDKGVRGTLVDPALRPNKPAQGGERRQKRRSPEEVDRRSNGETHPEAMRTSVTEARLRAVKRVRAGTGLPQGGLVSRGRSRVTPAKHSVICGGASHGARKSNGPSGARVVGRLQRSVRSILPPRPRGAARQTEEARWVARSGVPS
jgi:hypothetical protein